MEILLVDGRYVDEIRVAWGEDYVILPTTPCDAIAEPVSSHPDMVLFDSGDALICAQEVFSYYESLLFPYGIKLVQGKAKLASHYPDDVAYNVARAGKTLIGHKEAVDPVILQFAEKRADSFFPTRQGYAKCSSCVVSDRGIITEDSSIARSACEAGLDVLLVSPAPILLPGYEHGFWGGSCGLTKKNELLVFGELASHPDEALIRSFCKKHGAHIRDLKGRPLTDIGTIMSILV